MTGKPRVAVITPYCHEPLEVLSRCHQSVVGQTLRGRHFLVADGHPRAQVAAWDCEHIVLSGSHRNNGNTPRAIGGLSALGLGYSYITYLDADNWYEPDHLQKLVSVLERTGADVVSSRRAVHDEQGGVLLPEGEDSDATVFCDTSCMMFSAAAFDLVAAWGLMPNPLSPIGDRIITGMMNRLRLRRALLPEPTVHFTSRYAVHYLEAGRAVPDSAQTMGDVKRAEAYFEKLPEIAVDRLLQARSVPVGDRRPYFRDVEVLLAAEQPLPAATRAMLELLRGLHHPRVKGRTLELADARAVGMRVLEAFDNTDPDEAEKYLCFMNAFPSDMAARIAKRILNTAGHAVMRPRLIVMQPALPTGEELTSERVNDVLSTQLWRVILPQRSDMAAYRRLHRYGDSHCLCAEDGESAVAALVQAVLEDPRP